MVAHNVFGLYKERFLTFGQAARCLSHVTSSGEYPVTRSVEELFEPVPAEASTQPGLSNAQAAMNTEPASASEHFMPFTSQGLHQQEEQDVGQALLGAYSRLTAVMISRGAYVESECLSKRKINWLEQCKGDCHPKLIDELTELSGILCAEHKFKEAAFTLLKIIAILNSQKAHDGPRLATFLSMLAGIYLKLRQYADAECMLARALDIRQLYLPVDHPDIRQSLHDYGWLLYKTGRDHEGQKLLTQARASRA